MITIRSAVPMDASAIAEVYVASWLDTYAGILPSHVLVSLSVSRLARQWSRRIRAAGHASTETQVVMVADHETEGIIGFGDSGPARDRHMTYEAEIYTLYVDPNVLGEGIGRGLVQALFGNLVSHKVNSVIIWALADNPNRHFYSAIGGRLVAERISLYWGEGLREMCYGWSDLKAWYDRHDGNRTVGREC